MRPQRSWSVEKAERERAIVRLLRGNNYTREDAQEVDDSGEGSQRERTVIKKKSEEDVKRYGKALRIKNQVPY